MGRRRIRKQNSHVIGALGRDFKDGLFYRRPIFVMAYLYVNR